MSDGILLMRVVVGLTVTAHRAQEFLRCFGGRGLRGPGTAFGRLSFHSLTLAAFLAGLSRLGGDLLLAAGLLTPIAEVAISGLTLGDPRTRSARSDALADESSHGGRLPTGHLRRVSR